AHPTGREPPGWPRRRHRGAGDRARALPPRPRAPPGEPMSHGDLLWSPPADVRERSQVGRYLGWLEQGRGRSFDGYADLWRWSVEDLPGFWSGIWDRFDLGGASAPVPEDRVLVERAMPGARWFPDVEVSWAERALAVGAGDPSSQPAVIS